MKLLQFFRNPWLGLILNTLFALGGCFLGFWSRSWWFITIGAYYSVLSVTRFLVLRVQKSSFCDLKMEYFIKRVTGFLLIALSICLIGINTLSAIKERATAFHEIIMIAIALFSFTKITMAIIGIIKARKKQSYIEKTLRNISLADGFVSIYSLQRSMLASFPGMAVEEIRLFNILTGSAVWLILLLLGINLIEGRVVTMAKSKLVEANKKIAKTVTTGYKKIESGVIVGYKKIEKGVVDGYTKIEDKFIDAYLTKDGESIEEAKARLKKKDQ